jgi:DEAD/DEAH box helicase domain-containing protein
VADAGLEGGRTASGNRRSAPTEAARLLADLTDVGARTVVFVRSRYSAEAVAKAARALLGGGPARRVATYRGGYLPEERRDLERRLKDGSLLGLVSTSALELGIDVSGLDAVLIAGWPGTLVALRQQAGRSGRAGLDGLAVWIAGLDPLDCYLVDHPEAILGAPLEATVFDPANPYVMAPHLAAAAAEWPLELAELDHLEAGAGDVVESLAQTGAVRRRGQRWFWVLPERASDLTDLRGSGGGQVQLVEAATGQVLGTVDAGRAPAAVHPGAVYLHQGLTFLVADLDLDGGLALLERAQPGYRTMPLDATRIAVVAEAASRSQAAAAWHFGSVEVTSQVTGYMKLRDPGSERIGTVSLDLPESTLRTAATWVTVPERTLAQAGLGPQDVPAALHAAEHAAIGLLPLLATCDRWDLGGLSTAAHPDTGQATIFIHDAVPGGAGFAERAYRAGPALLRAVLDRLESCPCEAGCPSCVQSPKCGNANQFLSKPGALALVAALLG